MYYTQWFIRHHERQLGFLSKHHYAKLIIQVILIQLHYLRCFEEYKFKAGETFCRLWKSSVCNIAYHHFIFIVAKCSCIHSTIKTWKDLLKRSLHVDHYILTFFEDIPFYLGSIIDRKNCVCSANKDIFIKWRNSRYFWCMIFIISVYIVPYCHAQHGFLVTGKIYKKKLINRRNYIEIKKRVWNITYHQKQYVTTNEKDITV